MDQSRPIGDGRVNQLGGMYVSGKPLPSQLRSRIIELACRGLRQCDISRQLKVTHGCISKLLSKYQETGNLDPSQNAGRPRVITAEIERKIDQYRREDPGAFCWELREHLIRDNVCSVEDAPSLSSISRLVKNKIINEAVEKKGNLIAGQTGCHKPSQVLTSFSIASILNMEGNEEGKRDKSREIEKQLIKTEHDPDSCGNRFTQPLISRTPSADASSRPQRRERTKFNRVQSNALEREFHKNPYPGIQRRLELACNLGIDESRIQVWFANRRAKGRRRNVNSDICHFKGVELCNCHKNTSLSPDQKFAFFFPQVGINQSFKSLQWPPC